VTHWLAGLIGVLSMLPLYFISLGCWNLRLFSRSKLEVICREARLESRFESILSQHEKILIRLEFAEVLAVVVAWVGATWCGSQLANHFLTAPRESFDWIRLLPYGLVGALSCLAVTGFAWGMSEVSRERSLAKGWPLLQGLSLLGMPFASLAQLTVIAGRKMTGLEEETVNEAESLADELRSVTEEGHREGVIEDEARTMIRRVIDFSEVDVADIMTPRTEMVCINADASLLDARAVLLVEGHSRVPVIGKTTDEVLGILHAKDLLRYLDASMGNVVTLAEIAREPFYVPKTMGVQNLLEAFKKQRAHLAIVLDEYGGVAGLVTMEDILEELVGEIVDEFDSADDGDPFREVVPGCTDVSAKAHLDDIKEHLGIELPSDGQVDTLGGFVFSSLGRIPVTGEQFQIGSVQFTVLEAHKRRVVRLRLKVLDEESAEAD
jgi:putative hemolysin